MKRVLIFNIILILIAGCVSSKEATLRAMKRDYLNGRMSKDTYLKRSEEIKQNPDWSPKISQEQALPQEIGYYEKYRSRYVDPKSGLNKPGTSCYKNSYGGITCEEHVYTY